jgi:hypothetical protein
VQERKRAGDAGRKTAAAMRVIELALTLKSEQCLCLVGVRHRALLCQPSGVDRSLHDRPHSHFAVRIKAALWAISAALPRQANGLPVSLN